MTVSSQMLYVTESLLHDSRFIGQENLFNSKLGRPSCHLERAKIQLASIMERYTKTSSRDLGKWPSPKTDGKFGMTLNPTLTDITQSTGCWFQVAAK